jgi:hypothetical protein
MINDLLKRLDANAMGFAEVLDYIAAEYEYYPSSFKNGELYNAENENQGSARILAFAEICSLSKEDTLRLFAEHYRAVLADPDGAGHQNIRQFMQYGWEAVKFDRAVLVRK